MKLNHHVYIGWYAEFDYSKKMVENGIKKIQYCSNDESHRKHFFKPNMCSVCNTPMQVKKEIQYVPYPRSPEILCEGLQEQLSTLLGEKLDQNDLKQLEGSIAIFPEFVNINKEIIMAPGVKYYSNLSKIDGFADEIDIEQKPSEKWVDAIKRIFKTDKVNIKFGIVMEVV